MPFFYIAEWRSWTSRLAHNQENALKGFESRLRHKMNIEEYQKLIAVQRKPKKHVESYKQSEAVKWFRLQYPQFRHLLFSVPNEAAGHNGRILKEGVVAGVADLIFLYPAHGCHALCLEFKTEKGVQSQAQKDWQSAVEKLGYKYVIVRNFETFYKIINFWINP